jgi:hypothetical protein
MLKDKNIWSWVSSISMVISFISHYHDRVSNTSVLLLLLSILFYMFSNEKEYNN